MSDAPQGPGWWQASDGKYYPPQQEQYAPPQQQYARPQYGQPEYQQPQHAQPPQKKRSGCVTALLVVGGLVVLGVIVLVIVIAAAGKKVSDNNKSAANSASATCSGFSYPDKQKLDHCAQPGGEVKDFGLTVTASALKRNTGTFGAEICSDVSYVNRDSKTHSFNTFDWKLQTPAGQVKSFELTGATLQSGDLVAGGTTSGSVCFKDTGEKGQFVLIWKPDAFRNDRGIWLSTL